MTTADHSTREMQRRLRELADRLGEDASRVEEPRFKAMFKTAAAVLAGLQKAYSDVEQMNERDWR